MGWQVIIAPSAQRDLADIVRYVARHGRNRKPSGLQRKSLQIFQCLEQFVRASRASDVMSHHTTQAMRLHRGHFMKNILNNGPANGRERVAIVKTKRRELVTLAAEVQSFAQGQFALAG